MSSEPADPAGPPGESWHGFASFLALFVPFTPIAKEGGLSRVPIATLGLIALNLVVHFFAWPAEQGAMRGEARAAAALAEVELTIEQRWLGARGGARKSWVFSSRLRGRTAFEEKFWASFEEGRIVPADETLFSEWREAHEAWEHARSDRPYFRWGSHPGNGNPLSWLTSMFLHFGFFHLAGNMLGLWIAGSTLEDVWGPRFLVLIYVASGLFGELPNALFFPRADVIGVGASGAVAGLFGAFLVRLHAQRLRFVILPMLPTVALPGWVAFLPWAIFELRNALAGVFTGIAHWVHVGGCAAGALIALLLRWANADELAGAELDLADRRHAVRKRERLEEEAATRQRVHDLSGATRLLAEACRADPGAHRSFQTVLERLALARRPEEAAELAIEVLDSLWSRSEKDEYAEAFSLVQAQGLASRLSSLQLLHGADALAERRPQEAAETLHALLTARPADPLAKPALSRYADLLERLGDAEGARAARAQLAIRREGS